MYMVETWAWMNGHGLSTLASRQCVMYLFLGLSPKISFFFSPSSFHFLYYHNYLCLWSIYTDIYVVRSRGSLGSSVELRGTKRYVAITLRACLSQPTTHTTYENELEKPFVSVSFIGWLHAASNDERRDRIRLRILGGHTLHFLHLISLSFYPFGLWWGVSTKTKDLCRR